MIEQENTVAHCNLCHSETMHRLNESGYWECDECGAFLPEAGSHE